MLTPATLHTTLGADIRAIRKARGVTLADLAERLNRSIGWISQVERDLSQPSFEDLEAMANALSAPLSLFFGQADAPEDERGIITRSQHRRSIGTQGGLTESLLSPDLTDTFEVVHSVFAPGAARTTPIARPTQEVGTLIAGTLDLTIGPRAFTVTEGDTFRIRSDPYTWANPYREPAVAIWVISPPVY